MAISFFGKQLMRVQLGYQYLASFYWVVLLTLMSKLALGLDNTITLIVFFGFFKLMWLMGYLPHKTMVSYAEVGYYPYTEYWMDFWKKEFDDLKRVIIEVQKGKNF